MGTKLQSIINFPQKSVVEATGSEILKHITASAGGWPTLSRAGILGGVDFTIESGSNEIKIYEFNTNQYAAQVHDIYGESYWRGVAQHAATQSYDNVIIYSTYSDLPYGQNPPNLQKPYLSSSFAEFNISCSFNYNSGSSDRPYNSMRGQANHSGSFHLILSPPSHTDDNIYKMVSASFDKRKFREFLYHSKFSGSLIEHYNSGSDNTPNYSSMKYPDYVIKTNMGDASMQKTLGGEIYFRSYRTDLEPMMSNRYLWPGEPLPLGATGSQWDNWNYSIEKFIITSGSEDASGNAYIGQGRMSFLLTEQEPKILSSFHNSFSARLSKPSVDASYEELHWGVYPYSNTDTTASGSLIRMFDGSTKQIQDIQVGDVVMSYQPGDMPNTDTEYLNWSASIEDITQATGSVSSGSVVVGISEPSTLSGYFIISGSNNFQYYRPSLSATLVDDNDSGVWRFKPTHQLTTNDKMFDSGSQEIGIVSIEERFDTSGMDFYSLDVEDIDTYFSSDVLVHNLPKKF